MASNEVIYPPCEQCPFTGKAATLGIIRPSRLKSIKADLVKKDAYFICHKGSIAGLPEDRWPICGGYYHTFYLKKRVGWYVRLMELAGALIHVTVKQFMDTHKRHT